jgi:hypothetical protein
MGLTMDFGPYAFMDVFERNHICNHTGMSRLSGLRTQISQALTPRQMNKVDTAIMYVPFLLVSRVEFLTYD